jgi:hypothetical protein
MFRRKPEPFTEREPVAVPLNKRDLENLSAALLLRSEYCNRMAVEHTGMAAIEWRRDMQSTVSLYYSIGGMVRDGRTIEMVGE